VSVACRRASFLNCAADNTGISIAKYFGQIMWNLATQTYGINLNSSTQQVYNELQNFSSTSTNLSQSAQTVLDAGTDLTLVWDNIGSTLFGGVLWMLPCAGGALVMIGAISMVRHPKQTPLGLTIDLATLAFGVAVGLLGLLDIGNKNVAAYLPADDTPSKGIAPIYNLVKTNIGLAIPTIIYFVLICFQFVRGLLVPWLHLTFLAGPPGA
jgi:hypothetical protein